MDKILFYYENFINLYNKDKIKLILLNISFSKNKLILVEEIFKYGIKNILYNFLNNVNTTEKLLNVSCLKYIVNEESVSDFLQEFYKQIIHYISTEFKKEKSFSPDLKHYKIPEYNIEENIKYVTVNITIPYLEPNSSNGTIFKLTNPFDFQYIVDESGIEKNYRLKIFNLGLPKNIKYEKEKICLLFNKERLNPEPYEICYRCKHYYNEDIKKPFTLKCKHVICTECIEDLYMIAKGNIIKCPRCNRQHKY